MLPFIGLVEGLSWMLWYLSKRDTEVGTIGGDSLTKVVGRLCEHTTKVAQKGVDHDGLVGCVLLFHRVTACMDPPFGPNTYFTCCFYS